MNSPMYTFNKSILPAQSPNSKSDPYSKQAGLFKKFLRAKLFNLVNHSVFKVELQPPRVNKKTSKRYISPYGKSDSNFIIKTFPNIIGSENLVSCRNDEAYVTPDELFYENFSPKEVEIIRSDPTYFKLNTVKAFSKVEFLRNKTLLEKINEEDIKLDSNRDARERKRRFLSEPKQTEVSRDKQKKSTKVILDTNTRQESSNEQLTTLHENKTILPNIKLNFKTKSQFNLIKKDSPEADRSGSSLAERRKQHLTENRKNHSQLGKPSGKLHIYVERKSKVNEQVSKSIANRIRIKTVKIHKNIDKADQNDREQLLIHNMRMQIKKSYLKG